MSDEPATRDPAVVAETARQRLARDVAALKRKARPGPVLSDAGRRSAARIRSLAVTTGQRIRARPAPWVGAGVAIGAVALVGAWMRRRGRRAR